MPGIADQLKSAPIITQQMVRQAMQEVQADPTQFQKLQECVDQQGAVGRFEDEGQYRQLLQFVLDYGCDKFVLTPNTQSAQPRQATITEARITKVKNEVIDRVNTPPPPPGRGYGRDPLNITGECEAGAKVSFYNASKPGRPPLGEVTAGADGKWAFQLPDDPNQPDKFLFGDQVGVIVTNSQFVASKPKIVPTQAFQITNTTINIHQYNGGPIQRTDHVSTQQMLDPRSVDERKPFYQDNLVTKDAKPPSQIGEPWLITLKGGVDAAEPNSTITVRVGGEVRTTTVADDGSFAIKVAGFTPGETLKLEVRDVNGTGMDIPFTTSPVRFDMQAFSAGMNVAPQLDPPHANQTVGTSPPWVGFKASSVTEPFGAVVIRNRSTGDVFELKADDKGSINAALGGVSKFDVLEIAGRDVNGIMSPKTEWAVVLPERLNGIKGLLAPTSSLNGQSTADVTKVIESIKGPPLDRKFPDGSVDKNGPYLRMPDTCGLPPFGQLAVIKDGVVIQTIRADKDGRLTGLLRGVHVDDQLNFRVLDAAGRQFAGEIAGWRVPGAGAVSKVSSTILRPDDRTITQALGEVGNGTLDVNHDWLKPFVLSSTGQTPAGTGVKLHYPLETFGAPTPDTQGSAEMPPISPAIATKLGGAAASGQILSISDNNGTKAITLWSGGSVGIDYVTGEVNAGNPNQPLQVPGSLASLTQTLKQCLTVIAGAYDQGKEPGDVSYDRAVSSAKAILYVFDRLCVQNPTQKDAIVAAAKAAFPAGGFAYELIDNRRVPPQGTAQAAEGVSAKRSSTLSLLDARAAAMGRVDVPTPSGDMRPPRIDSAIIMAPEPQRQMNAGTPVRVKGRANPGDTIQIFNYSTSSRSLIAEGIAGPDGSFNIFANGVDAALGDKLGIVASRDGKKSKTQLVPTDGYFYGDTSFSTGRPVLGDTRQPFITLANVKLENHSFDDKGKVKGASPLWQLSGGDVAVEPLAKVKVESTTADGRPFSIEVQADEEGRFKLEFPALAFAGFRVVVTDENGMSTAASMRTPGLNAVGPVDGNAAREMASGAITLHTPTGDVHGTIMETSYASQSGNTDSNIRRIRDSDRTDNFADIVLDVPYKQITNQGQAGDSRVYVRLKVPADEAKKLTLRVNDRIRLTSPALMSLPIDKQTQGQNIIEMRQEGEALIIDRDYPIAPNGSPQP